MSFCAAAWGGQCSARRRGQRPPLAEEERLNVFLCRGVERAVLLEKKRNFAHKPMQFITYRRKFITLMTTHSYTSFVANYDGSILSQYNTYMHSHPKEGEQGYSEADWNAWRQMHSEGDGIICDFGVYTVSDGKAKSYSYDVRYNHPDKSHWGNNCMTEVSVVAPKESPASFSARWKARWYMLRRQEERAPSAGGTCSVEG